MLDIKGMPRSFSVAGDRLHEFAMPRDLSLLPPKVAKAFEAVLAASGAVQKAVGKSVSTRAEANEALRDSLAELYDVASATSKAAREQHSEAFEYGVRRYARAIEDAKTALQMIVTAGQLHDMAENGCAVGLNPQAKTKAVLVARTLYSSIEALPAVPALKEN
ncbi:hypothetical protein [Streptomyces sp. NPDC047024]|uniref:hypothetical protein n=1 Tax=Streptomyces sp. NPDC047024 TaxID=3155476 RepID=UPI003408C76F